MSRQRNEPKIYRNQQLMDDFNRMMIEIKAHLYLPNEANKFHKPTLQEIDAMVNQIFNALNE